MVRRVGWSSCGSSPTVLPSRMGVIIGRQKGVTFEGKLTVLIGIQGSPTFSAHFGPTAGRNVSWGSRRRASPIFSPQINPAGRSVVA